MEALEFLKEKTRRCGVIDCRDCELSGRNNKAGMECSRFIEVHPAESIEIVFNWSKANPIKTYRQDFLEKFPYAQDSAIESNCPSYFYGGAASEVCGSADRICRRECWDRPMEESK